MNDESLFGTAEDWRPNRVIRVWLDMSNAELRLAAISFFGEIQGISGWAVIGDWFDSADLCNPWAVPAYSGDFEDLGPL